MIKPAYLQSGDKVAIVATARKIAPEELTSSIKLLQSWGLEVVIPEGLFAEDHQFAGNDETRARVLQQQLDDPNIKAIICARGGYGTVRIIDKLDFHTFSLYPKWIVGYSDVTVLHSHLHRHLCCETLHATMPINIPKDAFQTGYPATETLYKALFGEPLSYKFEGTGMNKVGNAEAPIVGGNLSILYSLCGSPSDIDTEGKILFIEDLNEYLYHIDRMIQNLKRCGKLSKLKGLVVGALSDMHDNTVPFGQTAEEIILSAVSEYDYPVCFHAPFGHIGTENRALKMGSVASLQVSKEKVSLSFLNE